MCIKPDVVYYSLTLDYHNDIPHENGSTLMILMIEYIEY